MSELVMYALLYILLLCYIILDIYFLLWWNQMKEKLWCQNHKNESFFSVLQFKIRLLIRKDELLERFLLVGLSACKTFKIQRN